MTLKKITSFCILLSFLALHAQDEKASSGATKPAQKPKAKTIKLLISRASEVSDKSMVKNGWFSAVTESYYYFRFHPVKSCRVIPRSRVEKSLRVKDYFGLAIPDHSLFKTARELKSTHVLIHSYDIDEGMVNYFAEIFTADGKKVVATYDNSFGITTVSQNLNECSQRILEKLNITLDPKLAEVFKKPIISSNQKNLQNLGNSIIESAGKADLKTAQKMEKISSTDFTMALATFKAAQMYKALDDCDNAGRLFNKVIMSHGFSYPALYTETSRNYRKCRSLDRAERLLSMAEQKGWRTPELRLEKANILEINGKTGEARIIYDEIIKLDPNQPDALLFLARQAYKVKSYEKSLQYAEQLIAQSERLGQANLIKGRNLVVQKKIEEALRALLKAKSDLPNDPDVLALLGDCYFEKKQYGSASSHYFKALGKRKNDLNLLVKTANAYREAKQLKKALEILNKNKSNFYNTKVVTKEIGLLKFELKDTIEAKKLLETCISIRPPDERVFLALGDIYAAAGENTNATRMYEHAKPLVTDKDRVKIALANLYITKKEYSSAATNLKEIIAKKPDYPNANRYLGDVYKAKKQNKTALDYYLKERQHHGDNAYLQQQIAKLYFTLKNYSSAEKESKKLINLDPTNAMGYVQLALIATKQKKESQAQSYLAQAEVSGKVNSKVYRELGKGFASMGSNSKAIQAYRKCLKQEPNNAEAWIELTEIYLKVKKESEAAYAYLKIWEIKPDKYKEYLGKAGHLFYKKGMTKEAYDNYSIFMKKGYKDPLVYINTAKMEYRKKRYTETISLLRNVTGKEASSKEVVKMLAFSYHKNKKYSNALPLLKKLLTLDPRDQDVIEMAALDYEKTGDTKSAASMYKKYLSMKKTKKHKEYSFHLGTLYEKLKSNALAITRYEQNIKSYPDDFRNYERLAGLYLKSKQYVKAEKMLVKATQNPSADPALYKNLSDVYMKQKKNSLATATFEKYLAKAQSDTAALFDLGSLYYEQKKYQKATGPLEKLSKLVPHNSNCLAMLGHAYAKAGKTNEAYEVYTRFNRKGFSDPLVKINLAKIEFRNKKYPQVINLLKNITGNYSNDPDMLRMLAMSYSNMGTHSLALAYITKLIKKKPNDIDIIEVAALTYEKTNENKSAANMFKKYISLAKAPADKRREYSYRLATLYEKLKSISNAITQYKSNIAKYPKDYRNYGRLAELYLASKRNANAIQMFKKATVNPKADPNLYKKLAELYTGQKKMTEAAGAYEKYLIKVTTDSKAWYELGNIYYKQKAYTKALKPLSRASDLMPQNQKCLALTGHTYFETGKKDDAYRVYTEFRRKGFSDPQVNINLAKMEFKKKQYSKVITLLKNLTGKHATDTKVIGMLALSYSNMGTHTLALSYIEKLITKKPKDQEVIELAAQTYEKTNDYKKAAAMYKKYIAIPKTAATASKYKNYAYKVGSLYEKMKSPTLSIQQYKANTVKYPKDYRNYERLAELYIKGKQHGNAIQMLYKATANPKADPNMYKKLAELYTSRKKMVQAAGAYEKYLAKRGSDGKAWYALGKIYYKQKKYTKSLQPLNQASVLMPQNEECLALTGHIYYSLKRKNEAYKTYTAFLKKGFKDPQVRINLAKMEFANKKYSKVITLLKNMTGKYASDLTVVRMLALSYSKMGTHSLALSYIKKLIGKKPNDPEVIELAALTYEKTGEFKSAGTMFKKYISLSKIPGKKKQEYSYRLGTMYEKQKATTPAISQYKTNTARYPKDYRNYEKLAELYLKAKQNTNAIAMFEKATVNPSVDPNLFRKLADLYVGKKSMSKAAAAYEKYLLKVSTDSKAWLELGSIYYEQKKYQKALKPLARASELMPHNDKCAALVAHTYQALGKKQEAAKIYSTLLKKGFKDAEMSINVAKIEYRNKDYHTVISLCKNLPPKYSSDTDVIKMLAFSYYKTKRTSLAVPYIKKLVVKKPNDKEVIEMAALAYEKSGDTKSATAMYKKFLTFPKTAKHKEYAYHLATLYEKQKAVTLATTQYKSNIGKYPIDFRNYERLIALYMKSKRFSDAMRLLTKATAKTSAPASLDKQLAELYMKQKKKSQAASAYAKYLKKVPTDSTAFYNLGSIYYSQKNYKKAIFPLNSASVLMPRNKECLFKLGDSYMQTGNYTKAVDPLKKSLSRSSKDTKILKLLTKCFTATKNNAGLIAVLEKRVTLEPKNFSLHTQLGNLLLKTGKTDKAITVLEKASKIKPSDVKTHITLIDLYKKKKKNALAMSHINIALKYKPNDADLHFSKARYHLTNNNLTQAKASFKKTVALRPKDAKARYYYGSMLKNEKQYNAAFTQLSQAVKYSSKNPEYLLSLAQVAIKIGKKTQATRSILKTLEIAPDNSKYIQWAGKIYFEAGDMNNAEQFLLEGLRMDKKCAFCDDLLGAIYYSSQQYAKAVQYFEKAVNKSSRNDSMLVLLANTLMLSGDSRRALVYYEQAFTNNPKNDEAFYMVIRCHIDIGNKNKAQIIYNNNVKSLKKTGWVYLAQGRVSELDGKTTAALSGYRNAKRLMPKNTEVQLGLARVYLLQKKFNQAIEAFSMAMVERPEDIAIFAGMGKAYYGLKNYNDALELLNEVLAKQPRHPDALMYTGLIYSKKKRHDKAVSLLEKAIDYNDQVPELHYTLALEYLAVLQFEDAISSFLNVLKHDASKATVVYKNVGDICYYKLKDNRNAKKYYTKYISSGGTNSKVRQILKSL